MRLLLLNPNTSESLTEMLAVSARPACAPTTELSAITAKKGVPYIATRADAVFGAAVALEMLAAHHDGYDAAIIAAFGDPGLGAARELLSIPVVGLAEAGMLAACMLGRRFGIVSFAAALAPWYHECVAWHGLQGRCAGIRTLDSPFQAIGDVQNDKAEALVALAMRAVQEDGADAIILAGAPLSGLAARVRHQIPVPVVDCVIAAVKQAEMLVSLRPRKPLVGTYRQPDAKTSIGLDPLVARLLSGDSAPRVE
jgi:Asp/Glu/hydantoin racemase